MQRSMGRGQRDHRPVEMVTGFHRNAEGSVLYRAGGTAVLCTASVADEIPKWMIEQARGWVTAEYQMHPRCNPARREKRDVNRNVPFPTAGIPDGSVASVRKALTRLAIEDSLDDLPPETADVVRLHALGGLSFAEVAERLELPGADAARKRYARALVKLGGILGELQGP